MTFNQSISIAVSILCLAACASGPKGVRVVNNGTSAIPAQEGQAVANLSGQDVTQTIAGKTFQYTRGDGNGFVTYNGDGSLTYQDDVRGAGNGSWRVSGETYCETFGVGKSEECGVFKSTGDAYFAANSRLVEIKI